MTQKLRHVALFLLMLMSAFFVGCEKSGDSNSDPSESVQTEVGNTTESEANAPYPSTRTDNTSNNTASVNENAQAWLTYQKNDRGYYTITVHITGVDAGTYVIVNAHGTGISEDIGPSGEIHRSLNGDFYSGQWNIFITLIPDGSETYGGPPEKRIQLDITLP